MSTAWEIHLSQQIVQLKDEVARLETILSELGFCLQDGEPMPCLTCGAGL